jgi:DNA-binding transcriptional LysR family regulator
VILPRRAARSFRPVRDFCIADLTPPNPGFDVSLYWMRRTSTDPASGWLRALLIELFGKDA